MNTKLIHPRSKYSLVLSEIPQSSDMPWVRFTYDEIKALRHKVDDAFLYADKNNWEAFLNCFGWTEDEYNTAVNKRRTQQGRTAIPN